MNKLLMVLMVGLMTAGCATEAADEPTGASADAVSEANAYKLAIEAKTFRSGHLACGRTLTLTASFGTEGFYDLHVQPCEGMPGEERRTKGNFKVVGGWLGGLVTNPTMKMMPTADGAESWSFEMKESDGVVTLTDEAGTLVPEGFLD